MVDITPFVSSNRADPAQGPARPLSAAALAGVRPKFRGDGIVLDLFLLVEMLAVHLCGFAAAALYVGIRLGVDNYYGQYSAAFLMLPIIFALMLKSRGLYQAPRIRNFSGSIGGVIACLLGAFGLLIIIGFALGLANDYSRVWYGLWLISAIPTVIATRAAASGFLGRAARSGLIRRKAAIYGDAEFDPPGRRRAERVEPGDSHARHIPACCGGRGRRPRCRLLSERPASAISIWSSLPSAMCPATGSRRCWRHCARCRWRFGSTSISAARPRSAAYRH